MPVKPVIQLDHVSFRYGSQRVLDDVSTTVGAGEYLGIIGPNGGGKSTLIKIILGLLKVDSGTVKLFGVPQREFNQRYRIGYVPQLASQTGLEFPATVGEVVASGRTARLGLFRMLGRADRAAIARAMSVTGVTRLAGKPLAALSGGERQRVYIARALASEPDVLILDEPSVGVDIAAQEKFYTFIAELNRKHGITILFVSHDIDVVAHEAARLLCLNKHVVYQGAPRPFLAGDYLAKLYGKKVKFILHGH